MSDWGEGGRRCRGWVADHWGEVSMGGAAHPALGRIQEQQYPYGYQELVLQLDANGVVAEMKINVPAGEAYVPHAYLYQVGNTQPMEDVRLTAAAGHPGKLAARFSAAVGGRADDVHVRV